MRIILPDLSKNQSPLSVDEAYKQDFEFGITVRERRIQNEDCVAYLEEKWFSGTYINHVKALSANDFQLFVESPDSNVTFIFCLDGRVSCNFGNKTEEVILTKNQQFVSSSDTIHTTILLSGDSEFICLQLSQKQYKHLTGKHFHMDSAVYTTTQTPQQVRLILNALLNQKNLRRVLRISVEAKIFELLAYFVNRTNVNAKLALKKHDVDRILKAKHLVEEHLQSPRSLIELSREVGINDNKLKIGFKALTGFTVFSYLNKIRMEKAFYHLSVEKKTVSEVSFLVGYKNAQHFTVSFKKMYNILPGSLNRDKFLHANV